MQPKQDAALDPAELGRMDAVVGHAATLGVRVVLDVHNYGYGYGHLVGSAQTPDSSLADLWRRLATHYAQVPNVIYGIMNEPHDQAPEQWLTAANAAIAAIRATGARQEILVPGTFHTNGASWVRQGNSTGFADHVQDPAGNMAFEVHQYNDRNQSGSSTTPLHPMIGAQRLQDVTAWAEAHGHRLFLGEFGAGPEPESLLAMQNQLAFMQAHAAVWQGGTAWSGGPWWPKGNPWALDDVSGVIAPQVRAAPTFRRAPLRRRSMTQQAMREPLVPQPRPRTAPLSHDPDGWRLLRLDADTRRLARMRFAEAAGITRHAYNRRSGHLLLGGIASLALAIGAGEYGLVTPADARRLFWAVLAATAVIVPLLILRRTAQIAPALARGYAAADGSIGGFFIEMRGYLPLSIGTAILIAPAAAGLALGPWTLLVQVAVVFGVVTPACHPGRPRSRHPTVATPARRPATLAGRVRRGWHAVHACRHRARGWLYLLQR